MLHGEPGPKESKVNQTNTMKPKHYKCVKMRLLRKKKCFDLTNLAARNIELIHKHTIYDC